MSFETGTATDHLDLLAKLDTFLKKGHSLAPIYTGTGNGVITGLIGTASSVFEVITCAFTSSTAFTVTGSVSGSLGSGTAGTPFTCSVAGFTITVGGTAWVSGDTVVFTMTPPWTRLRWSGGKVVYNSGFTNPANVIDANTTTIATVTAASLPASIGIQLVNAEEVRSFTITGGTTTNNSPKDFVLEYSDNGSSWTTAQSYTGSTSWTSNQVRAFDVSSSPGTHTYWRIRVTANNTGTTCDIAEISFYSAVSTPATALLPWTFEAIYSAPGNANDITNYVGLKLFQDAGGDYWNFRLGAFTGYSAGSTFFAQPGAMTSPMLTLWNSTSPYWFMASGRRVVIVAKVSTVYVSAYMGLFLTYASPVAYAYPQLLGGSISYFSEPATGNAAWRWSTSNTQLGNWPMSSPSSFTTQLDCSSQVRQPNGAWRGYQRYSISTAATGNILPYSSVNTTAENGFTNIRENLDGSYPIIPIWFMETPTATAPNRQILGEPEGVAATTGHNMTSESTITIGRDTWIVFQNINKTAKNQFFAVLQA